MAHTRRSMLLAHDWDLVKTATGGIALASGAFATAQNVANECRLFSEDAYFAQDKGIPHFTVDVSQRVNSSVLRAYLRKSALTVPDAADVKAVKLSGENAQSRTLSGNIQLITKEGEHVSVAI